MTEKALEHRRCCRGDADRRGSPAGQARGGRRGDALRRERHEADAAAPRRRGRREGEHPRPQRRGAPRLPDPRDGADGTREDDAEALERGARGRVRGRVDGLDRRSGPHPQATAGSTSASIFRRPRTTSARAGRGHEPHLPVGRQRLRADRRDRVGAGEDPAARRHATPPGETSRDVLQHLALDHEQADRGRARGQARQPEARGGPEVCGARRSGCSAERGTRARGMAAESDDDPRPPVFILVCKNTKHRQGASTSGSREGKSPTPGSPRRHRRLSQHATGARTRSGSIPR